MATKQVDLAVKYDRATMRYIYLDQMHWISLAKAVKGRDDGKEYIHILDTALRAVGDNKVIFPISFAHVVETARAPNLDQRKLIAELMTTLSKGVVLRWSRPIVVFQIRNAVRKMFDEPLLESTPEPFGRGIEDVFNIDLAKERGWPAKKAVFLRDAFDTPEAWVSLLSHDLDEPRKAGISASERIAKESIEEYEKRRILWNGEQPDFPKRAYSFLFTKIFWVELQQALHEINRSIDQWGSSGPDTLVAFW